MAWSNAGRVVIRVCCSGLRNNQPSRPKIRRRAVRDTDAQCRCLPAAIESDCRLLCGRESECGIEIGNGPGDQAAVVPPREPEPRAVLLHLVAHLRRLLK